MPFDWFDASSAVQFGESLAQFFIDRIPRDPTTMKGKSAHKQLAKQFDVIDKMYLLIEQFKLNNRLNVYKKAKFGSAFKYKLIDAGYNPALVDSVTGGLLRKL